MGVWVCLILRATGSLNDLDRSLAGDAVWRRKASRTFPRLKSNPKSEGPRRPAGETPFVHECHKALCKLPVSSDFSWPLKELYRELVVGSASDPLSERQDWMAEEFSLTWRLARNALPLLGLNFRGGLADMPDCARCGSGLEETAEHAFYYNDASFSHRHLVLYFRASA